MATLVLTFLLVKLRVTGSLRKSLPVLGELSDFHLTNQLGHQVTLSTLRGRPWLADIIFARCAGPCLKMSRQMAELQRALPGNSALQLISLTTDPVHDTPAVLQSYAKRFGADPSRWWFLTGTTNEIAAVAANSLKLAALEKPAAERETPVDLFIHSTIFVLVDKHGRLRGVYETQGETIDPEAVKKQIVADARQLETES